MMHAAAGFVFVQSIQRPTHLSSELLPDKVLSLSRCLCNLLPGIWGLEWANVSNTKRSEAAGSFGISGDQVDDAISWTTSKFGDGAVGWPGIFTSLDAARECASRFHLANSRLLGFALHEDWVESFVAEEAAGAGLGKSGIYEGVSNRVPLPEPGKILGWEVLAYEYGDYHSWLCFNLETDIANNLNVLPNEIGLIATPNEAEAVAAYCHQDDAISIDLTWTPWLLVEYDSSLNEV